jgi:hypothetical protein
MARTEEIASTEYEQRRHVFDLCRWVNSKLEEMRAGGRFDEQYFERTGNTKKLVEEAIPVSRLGLAVSLPESEVYITCLTGNQPYDALVEITGIHRRTFKVEVTTTETNVSVMRRQALSRYGHVALTGPIWKDGREIQWEGDMIDVHAEEEKRVALAFERLRTKVESQRYSSDTAILVYLSEYRPISLGARADLVRQTQRYLLERASSIYAVYYCYALGYMVDHVQPGHI